MKAQCLLGLFLLLWMGSRVYAEDTTSLFLQDLITTFDLVSPTIVYDADEEAPEICYTKEWVLCLPHFSNKTDKGNNERNTTGSNNGIQIHSSITLFSIPLIFIPYVLCDTIILNNPIDISNL